MASGVLQVSLSPESLSARKPSLVCVVHLSNVSAAHELPHQLYKLIQKRTCALTSPNDPQCNEQVFVLS